MDYYREWVFHKYLKTTPGNVTDYGYITNEILNMSKSCAIEDIFYDKYNAAQWVQQCTEEGLNMTPFVQTIGNFNNCTREFERLILSGKIVMDDNPITRYCIRNVELRMDFNGNVKPMKDSDRKKIDGVIAMLQALAAWIEATSDYKGTQIF
jgi:phage terminase large subunit-like protein